MDILDDLRAIDRLAGVAASRSLSRTLPLPERHDAARGAIVLLLAESAAIGVQCAAIDLINAGTRAIDDQTMQWRRDHGQAAPKGWASYWLDQPAPRTPDSEVPPRIALREVFEALPPNHQQALLTLAAHDDPQTAAIHLGLTYSTMQQRIRAARVAFFELWWDWEQAPRPPFDRRTHIPNHTHCGRGHEFTPENTRWRKSTSGRGQKRSCRQCDSEAERRRNGRAA